MGRRAKHKQEDPVDPTARIQGQPQRNRPRSTVRGKKNDSGRDGMNSKKRKKTTKDPNETEIVPMREVNEEGEVIVKNKRKRTRKSKAVKRQVAEEEVPQVEEEEENMEEEEEAPVT